MTTKLFTEEYVQQIAESLMDASLEDMFDFAEALQSHPYGEELGEAVSVKMVQLFTNQQLAKVNNQKSEATSGCGSHCHCHDEENEVDLGTLIAKEIAQQVEAKRLSQMISQEAAEQKLNENIRVQLATPNLHDLIKQQIETKSLIDLIKKQAMEQVEESNSLQVIVIDILNEIVNSLIEMEVFEDGLNFFETEHYELLFTSLFMELMSEKGLPVRIEYSSEYTAYILTEIAEYLVKDMHYELSFKYEDGYTVPCLIAG